MFLHFLMVTVRLGNHITTMTVKSWNIDINSIFPDFSRLFNEYQISLTHT